MAKETNRVKRTTLDEDEDSYAALQAIALYEPANHVYGIPAIAAAHAGMLSARTEEAQAEAAFSTARDNSVASEWAFHNLVLGAKDQVVAQFGRNSNEAQALKLKKTSERKAPQRKPKKDDKG